MGLKLGGLALVTMLSFALSGCWGDKNTTGSAKSFEDDPLFNEVITLVQEKYVKKPDISKMRIGALSGMLHALDNYSAYLPPDAYEALSDSTDGEFGGVGVEVYPLDGGVKVISAIDDTPAAKAGIHPGDLIVAINDKPTCNMSYSEIISSMHGQPETSLKLTIQRGDAEIIFTIKRGTVVINPVKLIVKDNIAYIRVGYFNDMVAKRLAQAIDTLKKSKENIIGIVLDLRNNPGGVLEQAVKTVGYFIKSGVVTKIVGRNKKIRTITTQEDTFFPDVPVVVLINSGSASASEIVAAALKFHERAVILGKRSLGKGSIQSVFPIPGNGGVKLTTDLFLTPSGDPLNGKGVQPDITVESQPNMINISLMTKKIISDDDVQLARSFEILKSIASLKRWNQ